MADAIERYVEKHIQRFQDELRDFLRIPSVSTESRYSSEVRRCADWLKNAIVEAGIEEAEVIPTGGHPIVYGEHRAGTDAPTVLIYGHYDVQPVDPEHLWTSPPFEPRVRDGRMYARGATDDKGQVHMHVKALETCFQARGGVPVNVKLLIEGEEEVGSEHLEAFLAENRDRLAADVVVISDTMMFAPDIPCITVGLRGIVYHEVVVRGPSRDLHSGSYGGAVVNPANALGRMIAGLHDADGRVTIPGFYDRVHPVPEEEREGLRRLPFDEETFQAEVGAPALGGEAGYSTLERLWYRPTLDVNGILSGFTGEGSKTVLPSEAMAKISMRLVPDQRPAEVADALDDHLRDLVPEGVTLEIRRYHSGRPWAAPADSSVVEAASASLERAFGRPPALIREGGSIPIIPLFEETLDVPVLLIGFGLPGSNPHAPDEWIDLSVYRTGIAALADLYQALSDR